MVMLILWILAVASYGFLYLKTTEWLTISRLGFESETPEFYLQKHSLYNITCMFLFLIAICIPLLSKSVSSWGAILVVLEGLFITLKGRANAIKTYRKIVKEMINDSADEANDILKKTDMEIWNELITREKLLKTIHK